MARQVLDEVRRAVRGAAAPTDRDLLGRFAAGDQAAFATLVRRHTGLVLGVCRRMLPTLQDAEDACQATFLVLSQKAATGRWQPSVAGWLFATARRVAWKARRALARRAKHEAGAAAPAPVSALDQMTGREAFAALDDELARLPDVYRAPLVLCYLEGLPREDAARRLGVPPATLKSQLERGRKRLADALTRRGIVLGAGLLAAAATSSAGASPPRLVDLILAAVGGSPSPAAAALAQGVAVNGVLSKAKVMALTLLGAAVVGMGFVSLPAAAEPRPVAAQEQKKDAQANTPRDETKPETMERTIVGKVVGPDGKGLAADLYLSWTDGKTGALAKTAADGTFRVTVPLKAPGAWLVAHAPGHGIDFLMPALNTPDDVTFRLPKSHPIRGRIVDPQGQPTAGVAVALRSLTAFHDAAAADRHLRHWAEEMFQRGVPPSGDRSVSFGERGRSLDPGTTPPFATRTDREGRYELHCVGLEQMAILDVCGPGVAQKEIVVLNRPGFDPKPINDTARAHEMRGFSFGGRWLLYGPEPSLVVEQEKIIRGRVTDRATGQPRAGVQVTFSRPNRRDLVHNPQRATTDRDGRYEIRGARKHKGYMVECDADSASGHLPCQAFADDTAGYEPITIDLTCAKGVVVEGRMFEKATGKAIVGQLYTVVLANNPFVKNYPTFTNSSWTQSAQTDKDGRFRVVTIPGHTLLMASPGDFRIEYKAGAPDPKYPDYFHTRFGGLGYYGLDSSFGIVQGCWCKVVDAKETDTVINVNVELEPATRMTVKVVDAAGKPVVGAHATGITHVEYENPRHHPKTDSLTLYNVDPKKERLVAVAHADRKLVGVRTIKADEKDAVVTLGSGGTVKGRLTDPNGKPLAGIAVNLTYSKREVSEVSEVLAQEKRFGGPGRGRKVVTDADGSFRIDAMFPEQEFRLLFQKGNKALGPDYQKAPKHTVAKHGDTLDLGTLKLAPRDASEEE